MGHIQRYRYVRMRICGLPCIHAHSSLPLDSLIDHVRSQIKNIRFLAKNQGYTLVTLIVSPL